MFGKRKSNETGRLLTFVDAILEPTKSRCKAWNGEMSYGKETINLDEILSLSNASRPLLCLESEFMSFPKAVSPVFFIISSTRMSQRLLSRIRRATSREYEMNTKACSVSHAGVEVGRVVSG